MAEIRVAPQRRNRAIVWVLLIVLLIAAVVAWYFLAGPGVGATVSIGAGATTVAVPVATAITGV